MKTRSAWNLCSLKWTAEGDFTGGKKNLVSQKVWERDSTFYLICNTRKYFSEEFMFILEMMVRVGVKKTIKLDMQLQYDW